MLALYRKIGSCRGAAEELGLSAETVRRIVREERIREEAMVKGAESASVGGFLRSKQGAIIGILNRCLGLLADEDKLQSATLPQIASAMGTLVEKFAIEDDDHADEASDALSRSLEELAKELISDIPEAGSGSREEE